MSFKRPNKPSSFNVPSVSTSGAPTIEFRFAGDTCTADLAGAHLYAEMRSDDACDLRLTDATGFVLANLVVNERPERNMTENLMDIGSALMWSHWRFTQAPMSGEPQKLTDSSGNRNGNTLNPPSTNDP